MKLVCPACSRPILSRRTKLCGFCQASLPPELLFTPEQVAAIEAEERAREIARKLRDEERAKAAARARASEGGGGDFGFMGFGG